MTIPRPDLHDVAPDVVAYIEALEAELARYRQRGHAEAHTEADKPGTRGDIETSEPPTTFNIITATAGGLLKRTPRHLYGRQARGGMGVFDLDAPHADPPVILAVADIGQNLILITSQGRAFPLAVAQLAEAPVRSRGQSVAQWVPLLPDERLALIIPDQGAGYLTLVTARGQVRRLRYHYFGANLKPGTILYDGREGGAPAAACWTPGDGELFIATRKGMAIRFAEAQVPVRGCLGMRVDPDDVVIGAAAVRSDSGVFLLAADGRGTIRLMSGFNANKEPGAGGKIAMKTERLVGAATVRAGDDVFILSKLGKIIRFAADETPAKEGVVQGVNCMTFRADEATALAISPRPQAQP